LPLAKIDLAQRTPEAQITLGRTWGEDPMETVPAMCDHEGMNLLLIILILLLLFGGGGFYFGGPAIGGGGLGLILVICLVVYVMGGFRTKK
jgi:hypothetical protein